jgi:hypothetical protein
MLRRYASIEAAYVFFREARLKVLKADVGWPQLPSPAQYYAPPAGNGAEPAVTGPPLGTRQRATRHRRADCDALEVKHDGGLGAASRRRRAAFVEAMANRVRHDMNATARRFASVS